MNKSALIGFINSTQKELIIISNQTNFTFTTLVPLVKFAFGLIIVSLYMIIILCLPLCTNVSPSSRKFLMMIFSLHLVSYLMLTLYSPFVALGYIAEIKNVIVLKIISTIFLTPLYALHLAHAVTAFNRFIAIKFPAMHDKLFSKSKTYMLMLAIFLYGSCSGLISWFDCCYMVYQPDTQVWLYPNDVGTNYRIYGIVFSNFGSALITGTLYILIIYHLHKMK